MEPHIPVLIREVVEHLQLTPGDVVIDGTFGNGGYTRALLTLVKPGGTVLALDLDEQALLEGKRVFAGEPVIFCQTSFAHMDQAASLNGLSSIAATVLDLGVSSMQIDRARRGFSHRLEGPLDMRFGTFDAFDDQYGQLTAKDIVNRWSEDALHRIFRENGEERYARRIAGAIVRRRRTRPFEHTVDLAKFVAGVSPTTDRHIHPATRVFQALRIEVNHELEGLEQGLVAALNVLKPGGRLAVVAFHSLEDRIVKQFGKHESRDCICPPDIPECRCQHTATLHVVTKRVVTPTLEEVRHNPRARSARLRVFEKRKR